MEGDPTPLYLNISLMYDTVRADDAWKEAREKGGREAEREFCFNNFLDLDTLKGMEGLWLCLGLGLGLRVRVKG